MTERLIADRHRDRATRITNFGSSDETVGTGHGDGPYSSTTQVGRGLGDDRLGLASERKVNFQRKKDLRQTIGRELNVHDRSSYFDNTADALYFCHAAYSFCFFMPG
jgi:hypothetical protein